MLRGIDHLWFEGDQEAPEISAQLGIEICQIARQLKLLRDNLCHTCFVKEVAEVIIFGQPASKDDEEPVQCKESV